MSLPSGLIFFLDFTYSPSTTPKLSTLGGTSVYGGGVVGQQITGGISLAGPAGASELSYYALNNGYSSPTASVLVAAVPIEVVATGTAGGGRPSADWVALPAGGGVLPQATYDAYAARADELINFDPDIASGTNCCVGRFTLSDITAPGSIFNVKDYITITATGVTSGAQVRRLTRDDTTTAGEVLLVLAATGTETTLNLSASMAGITGLDFVIDDNFQTGGSLGSVVGAVQWGLEDTGQIPEIDIKVDSVAVTAKTKKLKAKWTPELAQDLNAYHNLDAEVELTSILSEHIALEIDQEILEDLVKGATAETLFWSRLPGKFLERTTGAVLAPTLAGSGFPDFTGNVSEWYETLIETINDVSAQIHRKTLRGGANFIVCSPEVANLLEFTAGFRGSVTHDDDRGQVGAVKVGSLSKKFDVYVDPYFPRNVVLAGRKGSSFLESGYVYAPYVPLQMTPTIFGVEDFVPRKGVMTRYAKKMVRPDMYGLVVIEDL
jgi:hypothetical protein